MTLQKNKLRKVIVRHLLDKASVKQDIADNSEGVQAKFLELVHEEVESIRKSVVDSRIRLRVVDQGKYEFLLYVGSDILVFQLHSNVFKLPEENPLWKESYLNENPENGYFGVINVYNFLAESYEKNRLNDLGYLIARIFINRENRCIVEGRGPLDSLYKDLATCTLDENAMRTIIQSAIIYAIEFDLISPPYDLVEEVSVMQIQMISSDLQLATGKRLGFKFSAEENVIF